MKLLFAGSSDVSLASLKKLSEQHEIKAVLTVPDSKRLRGQKVFPTEVKKWAIDNSVSVFSPSNPNTFEFSKVLKNLAVDLACVVSYGKILKPDILSSISNGWVNLHFSLLPQYRGPSPVQYAILKKDKITGTSVFLLDDGMDTGRIYSTKEFNVEKYFGTLHVTTGELLGKLSEIGSEHLLEVVNSIENNTAKLEDQKKISNEIVTKKITKQFAKIDWLNSATRIERKVLACNPNPIAWSFYGDNVRIKIYGALAIEKLPEALQGELQDEVQCGEVLFYNKSQVFVKCSVGYLELKQLQKEGKSVVDAKTWANGITPSAQKNLTFY